MNDDRNAASGARERMPAPKGKGLVVEKEAAKVLQLAGQRGIPANASVMSVNVAGFFHVTQPLLLPMARTRWGRTRRVAAAGDARRGVTAPQ